MFSKLQHEIDATIRRLGRMSFKVKMQLSGDKRPSSSPYISGDSFRKLADHIYDEQIKLDPKKVQLGDIVFVGQELIHEYFTTVHPHITARYILICHNGDVTVDEKITNFVDDKIIHFFAQDLVVDNEKITPIPIGIENLHFYIAGVVPFFKKLQAKIINHPPLRKDKIFFNFSISTNPEERGPAKEYFLVHPLMETVERFMTPRRHSKILTTYKFVASPPGHAIESCRTWEALYLDTIPIVKDFVAMRYFKSLGLPIWIVRDWKELEGLTEKDLAEKYTSIMVNSSKEALYMDFWKKKIINMQNKVR